MLIGATASAALLSGIGGAALAAVTTTGTVAATAIEYGPSAHVQICSDPTAVEYGTNCSNSG
jgi:hypothetical protein